jgi:hypothetical protein
VRKFFIYDPSGRAKVRDNVPLLTLKTPLGSVPDRWITRIEPYIRRVKKYNDCWIWDGPVEQGGKKPTYEPIVWVTYEERNAKGEVIKTRSRYVLAKRFIAEMFVDTKDVPRHTDGGESFDVIHVCMNKNCLNPAHLEVRTDHGRQRDQTSGFAEKHRAKRLPKEDYWDGKE